MYNTEGEAREAIVTKSEAIQEIKGHGHGEQGILEFFQEVGEKDYYKGSEVLDWLGY